MAHYYSHLPNC